MAGQVTLFDRDYLDPVLGGDLMVELMERDRSLWQRVGEAVTAAFLAGKEAQRAQSQP